MKKNKITPLNNEEKKYLREELLNRLKDVFFIKSEYNVNKIVNYFSTITFYKEDTINFNYNITMTSDDVLQIIGRKRRIK